MGKGDDVSEAVGSARWCGRDLVLRVVHWWPHEFSAVPEYDQIMVGETSLLLSALRLDIQFNNDSVS